MNRKTLFLFVLLLISALSGASRASTTQNQWLVTVQTKSAPSIFNYQGATLTPVTEAQVSFASANSDATPTVYENFWGASGKPLALQRYEPLSIPPGDGIAFKIVNGSDQPFFSETQLAVDAVLRIMLDAQLNANPVLYVSVPSTTFSDVVSALSQQNFIVKDTTLETPLQSAALVIYVVDYSGQMKSTLYYPQ